MTCHAKFRRFAIPQGGAIRLLCSWFFHPSVLARADLLKGRRKENFRPLMRGRRVAFPCFDEPSYKLPGN